MENAFVFYAYWNGAQVRDLFEGLVSVTAGGGFAELAVFLVVTGLVAALLIGAVKGEGWHVISYVACAVLFWFVAVVPKATVAIEDVRSKTVYTVDNVPLSMAFFASASSRIGHWLTQTYETAFVPADVARYSSFGAVYPERVLEVLQKAGPVTVEGRETLTSVLKNCVIPEAVLDRAKAEELLTSGDLWTTVKNDGWVNPARLAVMPDGQVLKCPQAVAELEKVLTTKELPALTSWVGMKLGAEDAAVSSQIASSITATESILLGISRSAESSLKHSLMLTALPKVMSSHAVETAGPAAMASALARSQGNLAGEINYRTMARMAEDSLPKIRNALEFVVIAMFPVVALIALVSGTGMATVVRSYITLLLTVQLWPALSSVVNYLVITHDTNPFTQIALEFGGASLQAATLIRETGASSQAIAGALLCAVPVISYALVRAGDMAVGQLVGGLMHPAQSAANAQGASIASGNISQGNVSVNNVAANNMSSNKQDASVRSVESGTVVTQTGYGSVTRAASGEVTGIQRTGVSMGVTGQVSQSFVRGHSVSNVGQTSTVTSDAARFSFAESARSTDSTQRSFAHALREALTNEHRLATAYSDTQGWGNSVTLTRGSDMSRASSVSEGMDYSSKYGVSLSRENYLDTLDKQSAEGSDIQLPFVRGGEGAAAGGSMPLSGLQSLFSFGASEGSKDRVKHFGVSGKMQGGLTFEDAQSLVDNAVNQTGTLSSDSLTKNYQMVRSAAENVAASHSDDRVRNMAVSFVQSLDQAHVASRDRSTARTDSVAATSGLSEDSSGFVTTSADAGIPLMQAAVARYGSPEAALRALFESNELEAFAAQSHDQASDVQANPGSFGPGSFVSAVDRNAAVYEAASANVANADAANRMDVGEAKVGLLDPEVQRDTMLRSSPEGALDVRQGYQDRVRTQEEARAAQVSQMNFDRGVLLVAREAYAKENHDKNFTLRNAFLGGWGYRSGDEIQDDLRAWASNIPELRERLEKIGASDRDYVSTQDWESLVEIGRVPKGIRPGS